MTRHESREQAFILAFEREFTQRSFAEIMEDAALSRGFVCSGFCRRLTQGLEAHQQEVDDAISRNLKGGWTLRRLSKVALSVLRIAVYELLFEDDVPDSVAANEAVELAKEYGGPADAPYVNGVLSGVLRDKREAQA